MKKTLSLLFAVLCVAACQLNELSPEIQSDENVLYASMESIDVTKTSMDEYNNVLWSEEDQLVAFMKTTLGIKYQVKEQYVGTTTGGFSKVQGSDSGDDLESGQEIDHNVVVYPYSDQVWCMKYDNSTPARSYKLNVVLPETQTYAENSFANGSFPMVAVSTNNQLTFKNICGGVKLQFKGVDKIKSLKLEGIGGEKISGKSSVVAYADGTTPTITMASAATKSVTLDCGDGVQLNETTPTTFILAVPPITFASGIKITITDTDGLSKTLTNTASNTIKRSTLLNFPVITYKQNGVLEFPEGAMTSYELPAEGGTVEVPVITNLDYEVVIPDDASDWISVVETKALREEVITLFVAANDIVSVRSAEVSLIDSKGAILQAITITQNASKPQYPEDDEIWYTSKNGSTIYIQNTDVFGANIISHTYENGKGVIKFDGTVTQIGDYAFYESSNLISITIPDGVTSIGHGSFCKCYNLTEFKGKFAADNGRILAVDGVLAAFAPSGLSEYTVPDYITTIGYEAFRECDNLTDITITNGVYIIDGHAFQNCDKITEITIPDSVTSIGEYAFDYCKALANVNLGAGVRVIKHLAFYGCRSLRNITIPDSVTEVGSEAFQGCSSLTSITIGKGLTTIAGWLFAKCTNLTDVYIPDNIKEIKGCAFIECTSLESIIIPASVESIGEMAFVDCSGLKEVYCKRTTPPWGGNAMFSYNKGWNGSGYTYLPLDCKIYVPAQSVSKYKTQTWWSDYASIIFTMPADNNVINLSKGGTANSYIVSESGSYKFTPSKGNSDESVGSIASVEVLWESFGTDVTPNVGDLVKNVKYEDGVISFETPETYKEGNAVIAAKDASGKILWSWHIWLTDQPEGQVYYNNAGTMMDRNLGATSATPGDVGALGLLYQWGRKDPFLGAALKQVSYEAKSTITWPTLVDSDSNTGTISYATANPTVFIAFENHDWHYASVNATSSDRWTESDKPKSVYDPCPQGWRVPDGGYDDGNWVKVANLTSSSVFSFPYDSKNRGMNFSGKFGNSSNIWYPAAGSRYCSDTTIDDVGYYGFYWSADYYRNDGYLLFIRFDESCYVSFTTVASSACSVRCISE